MMPKTVTVPLKIMISEHKQTIKALKKDASPTEVKKEMNKQTKQLKRYESMNKSKTKIKY